MTEPELRPETERPKTENAAAPNDQEEKGHQNGQGYQSEQSADQLERNGRRYSVGNQRGQARSRFRYIESNHPSTGCRFL